jgi:DNA-binding transcriptional LysR family regulator
MDWNELNNYPIVTGRQSSVVRRVISDKFKSLGIEMRPIAIEVDNVRWSIALVEQGKGLSFALQADIEEPVREGKLKIIELNEDIYLTAVALLRPDTFISPIIDRFLSMVKQAFNIEPERV